MDCKIAHFSDSHRPCPHVPPEGPCGHLPDRDTVVQEQSTQLVRNTVLQQLLQVVTVEDTVSHTPAGIVLVRSTAAATQLGVLYKRHTHLPYK